MVPKKVLEELGLSDKEARVYLTLLEIGASPVQKIAQKAGVNRATTYVNLEVLMKLGLVSTVERGVKTFYSAESPEQLKSLISKQESELERKKNELNEVIDELNLSFASAGGRPIVRFFEGANSTHIIESEILNKTKSGTTGYSFVAQDSLMNTIPKYESGYLNKRVKKKILLKTIYTNKKGPIPNATSKTNFREAYYLKKEELPCDTSIAVYGENIAFYTLSKKPVGVIIESEELAKTLAKIFDLAIKQLAQREKNKK